MHTEWGAQMRGQAHGAKVSRQPVRLRAMHVQRVNLITPSWPVQEELSSKSWTLQFNVWLSCLCLEQAMQRPCIHHSLTSSTTIRKRIVTFALRYNRDTDKMDGSDAPTFTLSRRVSVAGR
eukprot:scaffold3296_cov405-Prasinococcus_capsulatus_cf.AAC.4